MTKPLLLINFCHDYAARDIIDSGILDDLKSDYDLCFATTPDLKVDLSTYGPIVGSHTQSNLRFKLWTVAFGLRHLAGLDPVIKTQENRLEVFQRGRSKKIKYTVLTLHKLGLSSLVSKIMEKVLAFTTPNFLKLPRKPDIALLTSGINDPFWDDVVTLTKRMGIPSLTLTINWDNIAHKIFLQQPDFLGVWGPQAYLYARLLQKVPAKKVKLIGAPRFELYRKHKMSRQEAREKLGLPQDKTILLFAGAGIVFDEVSLIEEFEQNHSRNSKVSNTLMIYKPHPKRHPRAAEPKLQPENYEFTQVLDQGKLSPLSDYPALLSAVDGLVTPLSTMMLEGAIMGLPALGLAYDDPAHGDYSWDNARLNTHLQALVESRAHIKCHNRDQFLEKLDELLLLLENKSIAEEALRCARFAVHDDDNTCAQRISSALAEISNYSFVKAQAPVNPEHKLKVEDVYGNYSQTEKSL